MGQIASERTDLGREPVSITHGPVQGTEWRMGLVSVATLRAIHDGHNMRDQTKWHYAFAM